MNQCMSKIRILRSGDSRLNLFSELLLVKSDIFVALIGLTRVKHERESPGLEIQTIDLIL